MSSARIWAESVSAPSLNAPPHFDTPKAALCEPRGFLPGAFLFWPWEHSQQAGMTPEWTLLGVAHNQRQMESWWRNTPASWPLGWDNSRVRLHCIPEFSSRIALWSLSAATFLVIALNWLHFPLPYLSLSSFSTLLLEFPDCKQQHAFISFPSFLVLLRKHRLR